MHIVLFDGNARASLLPLTFTRPVGDLRIGILTIAEKWARRTGATVGFKTETYLSEKFPEGKQEEATYIEGGLCPTPALVKAVLSLAPGQSLHWKGQPVAYRSGQGSMDPILVEDASVVRIQELWHLFQFNGQELERDFDLVTKDRVSIPVHESNTIIGDRFFAEPGAKAWASVFNTTSGPIYLGVNAEVMEGTVVRGGLSIGEGAQVKMASKIYGPTTIGPECRVGGEVNNCVLWGYSNKGHDGFLGNAVVGQWCNLGADTNNSNLKNNYEEVKLWNYSHSRFVTSGLQFCGLIMADHSKTGINTMLNTGTVIGVSCNVFGSGFPRNFIPDFSWGGPQGLSEYKLEKALATAERVMERRGKSVGGMESAILSEIYAKTSDFRRGTTLA